MPSAPSPTGAPPLASPTVAEIEAVRRFSRFYTRRIGVLREGLLDSPFSLAEARVIYELAHHEHATATGLCEALGLDAGYLSRLVRGLHERGVVEKEPSPEDGRRVLLSLTREGEEAFAALNAASRDSIGEMLSPLTPEERQRLTGAMATVEAVLGAAPETGVPYVLRPHQPGDLGWIVARHGALYAREHGYDERFEALVASVVASFGRDHDPSRERCWIAERDGENVGSVMVVVHPEREGVARLRLLLVEPGARGLGIGGRLVSECTRFARQAGYHTLTLWTSSALHAARRLYEREGYRLVHEEPYDLFPEGELGQTWELELAGRATA